MAAILEIVILQYFIHTSQEVALGNYNQCGS